MPTQEREPNHSQVSGEEIVLGIVNERKLAHPYAIAQLQGNNHRVDSVDLAMAIFPYGDGNCLQTIQFNQQRELAEYWQKIADLTVPGKPEARDFDSSESRQRLASLQKDLYHRHGLPAIIIFITHRHSVPKSETITLLRPTTIPLPVALDVSQEAAKLELVKLELRIAAIDKLNL